ncbi:MAG: sulfatase-like hydrolase/transferase [Bryobacterales bacterium]|nr:sulfatase-like hydrolase/transferase [Bryobacterales bacterium]
MNRRAFLGTLGAAAMQPARRPNVVFILADDLGWGDLPCYGHRNTVAHGGWLVRGELKMPHLDRMAREGTLFTQFYVASAVCSPSRAGFLTGQFPSKLGIHDYLATPDLNRKRGVRDSLDPSVATLPALLRRAGYATGHFGKWHLSSGANAPKPEEYGLDVYDECTRGQKERPLSSERIADAAIGFIEANRARPFYLNLWLHDPHSPLHPSDESMAVYKELSPRWGTHRGAMEVYYGVLTEMDRQIGRVLAKLDESGLSSDTIVVFSSDNGPESGLIPFVSHYGGAASAGPFRGLKRSLYEGGIRTPWMVRWPQHTPAGRVDNDTVFAAVDFLPTVAKLAGVSVPAGVDGQDLSGALLGKRAQRTTPLLWENRYPVYGHVLDQSPMLAVREGRWKLLLNPDRSRMELYDIPNDPSEMNNLAGQQSGVAKRLASKAIEWQKTLPPGPVDRDAGKTTYAWPGGR